MNLLILFDISSSVRTQTTRVASTQRFINETSNGAESLRVSLEANRTQHREVSQNLTRKQTSFLQSRSSSLPQPPSVHPTPSTIFTPLHPSLPVSPPFVPAPLSLPETVRGLHEYFIRRRQLKSHWKELAPPSHRHLQTSIRLRAKSTLRFTTCSCSDGA